MGARIADEERIAITSALQRQFGLDAHELHLMRKIANLLYVRHGDYIAAKQRAREVAGVPPEF